MAAEPWDPVHPLPRLNSPRYESTSGEYFPYPPASTSSGFSYPPDFPPDRQSLMSLPADDVDRLCAFYQLPCDAKERQYLRRAMLLQHLGVHQAIK